VFEDPALSRAVRVRLDETEPEETVWLTRRWRVMASTRRPLVDVSAVGCCGGCQIVNCCAALGSEELAFALLTNSKSATLERDKGSRMNKPS
jgi:hypothetical protein